MKRQRQQQQREKKKKKKKEESRKNFKIPKMDGIFHYFNESFVIEIRSYTSSSRSISNLNLAITSSFVGQSGYFSLLLEKNRLISSWKLMAFFFFLVKGSCDDS